MIPQRSLIQVRHNLRERVWDRKTSKAMGLMAGDRCWERLGYN